MDLRVELAIESLDREFSSTRNPKDAPTDTIVASVIKSFQTRSQAGINKYGTTMDRTDTDLLGWLQHLQEELMDATIYIEKIKRLV